MWTETQVISFLQNYPDYWSEDNHHVNDGFKDNHNYHNDKDCSKDNHPSDNLFKDSHHLND